MHLAAIDIGTNSLHMILVRVAADGAFEVIGREKDMVRLGAGGLEGRPLGEGAMAAALQTLARFKRLADSRQVDDIVAVATSAVREAPNGGDFLASVAERTGIQARVITGVEEASLIHRAAVHGIDVGTGTAVVIDIGGGSTEITLGTAAGVQQAKSFRLGVIRLGERFVKSDPLTGGDERRMVRHIRHELGDYARGIARAGYARVIGTSGTALALGSLALQVPSDVTIHHRRVSAKAIRQHPQPGRLDGPRGPPQAAGPRRQARRPDRARRGAPRHDPPAARRGRAHAVRALAARGRRARLHPPQPASTSSASSATRTSGAAASIELALRCNYAADHAAQVARLALGIFDQTRPAHGLDDRAREWLDFAALLHDVGEHISYERHHRHSYYLVKHGDLRGFEPDEIEVMALVTRYHRRGAPRKGHDALADLPRASRRAVRWLSAMLRVAESLDRSRAQLVDRVTLHRRGRHWTLRVAGRGDIELERWAAQRNARPLEAELGGTMTVAAGRAGG